MNGAAMGTYDDPIVVRLYIHLVRLGNGTGGVTQSNLQQQMSWLDQIFNEYEIYFDYCILEVNCEDCWSPTEGRNAIKELWATNSPDDGINLYLFPPTFTLVGEAEDVGSKNCFNRVDFYEVPHELGHCLGLFHTFENMTCPPDINTEYAPYYSGPDLLEGPNCDSAGDLICDTPAEPRGCNTSVINCVFNNPGPQLDYLMHPYIDPNNLIPRNFMSYNNICRNQFTEDQIRRIRDILADDGDMAEVLSPFSHIQEVTGTEVWTTPRYFNHDLEVEGNLTISAEVGFQPGCGIILKGTLEVDGGNLILNTDNNPCSGSNDKLWKGVQLVRSSTGTPSLTLVDATIESADIAISAEKLDYFFISAFNSKFKNNRVSLNNIVNGQGRIGFTSSQFIVDDNYILQSYYPQLVNRHAVPIRIVGCSFDFLPTLSASTSRQAISSYNNQVFMKKFMSTKNSFSNWSTAIRAAQNQGSKLTLITDSDFEGNEISIFGSNFYRIMAYDNTFDISSDDISDEGYGIYSIQAIELNYHHNEFSSTNSSVYSTGIYSIGTAGWNVVIGENDFSDLDVAVEAITAGTKDGGTMFLCNQNIDNRMYDFKTDFGIGPSQGRADRAAGNTFSHADNSIADSDCRAVSLPNNYMVQYYFDDSDSDETPQYYSSTTIDLKDAPSLDCDHFGMFQDPIDSIDFAYYLDTHDELLDSIADRELALAQFGLTTDQITALTAQLRYFETERDVNALNAVAFSLTRDTIEYDDVRTALALRDEFRFAIASAYTYRDEGDTSAMFDALEAIPFALTLTQTEEDDLDEILLLDSLLHGVYMSGRIEDSLTSGELDTVEFIADEGVGLARDHARALLCYFFGDCYDLSAYSISPFEHPVSEDNYYHSHIEAQGVVDVEEMIESREWHQASIYSVDGRLVEMINLEGIMVHFDELLKDRGLSGLFIIVLVGDNGSMSIKRWIP